MKTVIPGGSGQVGTLLARRLAADGHEVVVLSRTDRPAPWRIAVWDGSTLADWTAEIDGADAVVNLAGRSVNCRYTPTNRREIVESRVKSTAIIGRAIAMATQPPPVWLQMSTATIYAHRFDAANDESTGILGGSEPDAPDTWRFSIDVAKAWEQTCEDVDLPRTRKVLLRTAMVMSPDRGGVFDTLYTLTRFGLGGAIAGGRQFMSWIHEQDFVRAIQWLISHDELSGPVNLAAPNPIPQSEFMQSLRRASGTRLGLTATAWMLEIGTFLMRTESELIMKSRRVVPDRLLQSGFNFDYPEWGPAAIELCRRRRSGKQ